MPGNPFNPRRPFIEIEGEVLGPLRSLDGGTLTATVIEERIEAGPFTSKRLGPAHIEEFVAELGLNLGPSVASWIAATWSGETARRKGRLGVVDGTNKVVDSRVFSNASLTSVSVPALDASSKEAGYLTLKFLPETLIREKPFGEAITP